MGCRGGVRPLCGLEKWKWREKKARRTGSRLSGIAVNINTSPHRYRLAPPLLPTASCPVTELWRPGRGAATPGPRLPSRLTPSQSKQEHMYVRSSLCRQCPGPFQQLPLRLISHVTWSAHTGHMTGCNSGRVAHSRRRGGSRRAINSHSSPCNILHGLFPDRPKSSVRSVELSQADWRLSQIPQRGATGFGTLAKFAT